MGMSCLSTGDAFWRAGVHSWSLESGYHSGWSRVQLKQYRVNEGLWSLPGNRCFSCGKREVIGEPGPVSPAQSL